MRIIKCDIENRVETGPLQINDDWPGIFIRGDNAMHYAYSLDMLLKGHDMGGLSKRVLEGLVHTLKSCIVMNEIIKDEQ